MAADVWSGLHVACKVLKNKKVNHSRKQVIQIFYEMHSELGKSRKHGDSESCCRSEVRKISGSKKRCALSLKDANSSKN